MASTTPADLADLNHDGNTEATAVTNALADEKGYPMELVSGEIINIVRKETHVGGANRFFDAAGNCYELTDRYYGKLDLVVDGDEDSDEEPASEEGVFVQTGGLESAGASTSGAVLATPLEEGQKGTEAPAE